MFTQKIIDSDAFLEMPLSAQALYFHLNMRADDDGFINNPKRIQRTVGSSEDDLKLLIAKRFVICFESGVIVIKHWRMHNTLRKDRYNPTQYQEEFDSLYLKDNNSYTEKELVATKWQPNGNHLETQYSIVEYSIDKNSINNDDESSKSNKKISIKDEFETLWKMYPNKKGKEKALGYYQKARKSGTTFEDVEQGIKNYCKEIEVKKTTMQYIKHGSTWFNNKGWLDDYDTTFNPNANQKASKYSYAPDDGSDLPY